MLTRHRARCTPFSELMNPVTDQLPPLPLQPPRSSFSCDRHPQDKFSGFCTSCLSERLTILDESASATASSSSRRNSTSSSITTTTAAATKSICRIPLSNATAGSHPELRRTRSFSASKHNELGFFSGVVEPHPNTLYVPISIDDENEVGRETVGSTGAVHQTKKEDNVNNYKRDEIRVSEEEEIRNLNDLDNDVAEMEAKVDAIIDNLRSVKDQIDRDIPSKKPSLSKILSAASVWSKKWQNWRRKRKTSIVDRNSVVPTRKSPPAKSISRQYRETQSEIADYGFGRRSCDIGPRFSLDAGRVTFDDPPYSFYEPRASWDGYLIGRSFPKLPPMVGDIPAVKIPRSDMQIPVETTKGSIPGGSTQTREYYLKSSSRRRKGSNSIRTMAAPVMDNQNTSKTVSNAKTSSATIDHNHIHRRLKFHSIGGEKELAMDSNSLRDDGSVSLDKEGKKPRWWNQKLWRFVNRGAANRSSEMDYNGEVRSGFDRKVSRSNSSASWRKSNSAETQEPDHASNSLLRFYLTPLRGSRRRTTGTGTAKSARNMFRLY